MLIELTFSIKATGYQSANLLPEAEDQIFRSKEKTGCYMSLL